MKKEGFNINYNILTWRALMSFGRKQLILLLNLVQKTRLFIKIYKQNSDPELIYLWQQGDDKAFDALYLRYIGLLISEATKKVYSIDEAKELVQDVFLKLYLRRDGLNTISSLKSYLLTALRNRIYNHYQKLLSKAKYEKSASNNRSSVTDDLQDDYEAKELNKLIQEKIQMLPAQCRKVFLLSREEQLSYKEIAEQLNISVNTVDQHIQKALRLLRASVGSTLLLTLWMKIW